MKKIIVDIDMTITKGKGRAGYEDAIVNEDVVARLKAYKEQGFSIILNTSRNMNSYQNNIGLINKNTLPVIINWLDKNDIPYDGFMSESLGVGMRDFMSMTKQSDQVSLSIKLTKRSLSCWGKKNDSYFIWSVC